MIVLSDSVDRTITFSFFWTKHRNVTNGRMADERTNLPWLLQRSALRAMRSGTRC